MELGLCVFISRAHYSKVSPRAYLRAAFRATTGLLDVNKVNWFTVRLTIALPATWFSLALFAGGGGYFSNFLLVLHV